MDDKILQKLEKQTEMILKLGLQVTAQNAHLAFQQAVISAMLHQKCFDLDLLSVSLESSNSVLISELTPGTYLPEIADFFQNLVDRLRADRQSASS